MMTSWVGAEYARIADARFPHNRIRFILEGIGIADIQQAVKDY